MDLNEEIGKEGVNGIGDETVIVGYARVFSILVDNA